jgi:glycosyltransferase involved in cell wall biosynthesis
MDMPKLSIITCSYNQAEFIGETLQSVMHQSYENFEHIVVDGNSDDGTVEILEKYESKYNLRWISEPDRGQSHALNKGIEMATGDWIGFQMSDDYYLPDAFETIVNAIQRHPNAETIYGDVINVDADGNEINRTFNIPPSRFIQRYWSLYAHLQSMFFHADVFNRVGTFGEEFEYTMDGDLFWRLLDADIKQVHIPVFISSFRNHKDAKTPSTPPEEKQHEWDAIYGDYETPLSRYLSRSHLETAAKVAKALLLLRIGRFKAFQYNLKQVL